MNICDGILIQRTWKRRVANGIHGPKTYLDPIRHIYDTVDAVETVHSDGTRGHALVFSIVAEGERLASAIPTGEGSLRLLGAINLLSFKYSALLEDYGR